MKDSSDITVGDVLSTHNGSKALMMGYTKRSVLMLPLKKDKKDGMDHLHVCSSDTDHYEYIEGRIDVDALLDHLAVMIHEKFSKM
jgi:hypothetical protein